MEPTAPPPPPVPPTRPAENHDAERNLDLLGIFHYVVGGLMALFACFPIIHLVIGIAMLAGAFDGQGEAPPRFVGLLFIVIAAMFILIGWAVAILVILTGRWLRARQRHTLCMVMAGVECVFFPIGTVLGVLTLIVLTQERAKALFH